MRYQESVWIIALPFLSFSCAFQYDKPGDPLPKRSSSFASGSLSFSEVNEKVFLRSCVGCHKQASGRSPQLTQFEDIKRVLGDIDRDVFQRQSMPKNGTLTSLQLDMLRAWIDDGAPEMASVSASPPSIPPSTGPVAWSRVKKEIVDVSCASCHYAKNPEGLTDQTDLGVFRELLPQTIYRIFSEKELPMPPLPSKMGDDQKRLLMEWVIYGQQI